MPFIRTALPLRRGSPLGLMCILPRSRHDGDVCVTALRPQPEVGGRFRDSAVVQHGAHTAFLHDAVATRRRFGTRC
jgi:hypothetical protein